MNFYFRPNYWHYHIIFLLASIAGILYATTPESGNKGLVQILKQGRSLTNHTKALKLEVVFRTWLPVLLLLALLVVSHFYMALPPMSLVAVMGRLLMMTQVVLRGASTAKGKQIYNSVYLLKTNLFL